MLQLQKFLQRYIVAVCTENLLLEYLIVPIHGQGEGAQRGEGVSIIDLKRIFLVFKSKSRVEEKIAQVLIVVGAGCESGHRRHIE